MTDRDIVEKFLVSRQDQIGFDKSDLAIFRDILDRHQNPGHNDGSFNANDWTLFRDIVSMNELVAFLIKAFIERREVNPSGIPGRR